MQSRLSSFRSHVYLTGALVRPFEATSSSPKLLSEAVRPILNAPVSSTWPIRTCCILKTTSFLRLSLKTSPSPACEGGKISYCSALAACSLSKSFLVGQSFHSPQIELQCPTVLSLLMQKEVGLGDRASGERLSLVVQPALPLFVTEQGFGALGEDSAVNDLRKGEISDIREKRTRRGSPELTMKATWTP